VKNFFLLVLCVLSVLGIGFLSGFATMESVNGWYITLEKPFFNPPNYLFGPVWTILYFLIGISIFLILKLPASKEKNNAILYFCIQLLLNFCWSFIFFYFKFLGIALLEIIVLWIFILLMIIQFKKVKPVSAYLQIPYLIWVTFALVLNASIFYLNR
jgi:benzodiazapine receptor